MHSKMGSSTRALHLLALSSFAIAQPLLSLLSNNGEYFVARGAGGGLICAVAVGLLLLPPLLLGLSEAAIALLGSRFSAILHFSYVAILSSLSVLPPLMGADVFSDGIACALGLGLGVAATGLYARSAIIQGLISTMGAVPLVFAAFFFMAPDVRTLLFDSRPASELAVEVNTPVPIVLLIFDELPLSTLLDANGQINRKRFPGFAELADLTTWFRGASTVSDQTTVAIPALLTGVYPAGEIVLPVISNFPQNLFTWLGSSYALHVIESRTQFHIEDRDDPSSDRWPLLGNAAGIVSDLGLVYLHMVMPNSLREQLPQVNRSWRDFRKPENNPIENFQEQQRKQNSEKVLQSGEEWMFVKFVREIGSEGQESSAALHFLHTNLPHGAWHLLPSGESYEPRHTYGHMQLRWGQEPWWTLDAYRRHVLQAQVADRLLLSLIRQMQDTETFDSALLIVTADHGISFVPNHYMRSTLDHPQPEDVIGIPLFVKTPHQLESRIDNRIAEIVDIIPTISDVLNTPVPWPVDGCSLLGSKCPNRKVRRVWAGQEQSNVPLVYPADVVFRETTQRRMIEHFGSGDEPDSLYSLRRFATLMGKRLSDVEVAEGRWAGTIILDPAVRRQMKRIETRAIPRFVGMLKLNDRGRIDRPGDEIRGVAIAVGNSIVSVVPAPLYGVNGRRVSAMMPPRSREKPRGSLRTFLVKGSLKTPTLYPLRIK